MSDVYLTPHQTSEEMRFTDAATQGLPGLHIGARPLDIRNAEEKHIELNHQQKRVMVVKVGLTDDREQASMNRYGQLEEMGKLEKQRLCDEKKARQGQLKC
jgi:hypothetical protein